MCSPQAGLPGWIVGRFFSELPSEGQQVHDAATLLLAVAGAAAAASFASACFARVLRRCDAIFQGPTSG